MPNMPTYARVQSYIQIDQQPHPLFTRNNSIRFNFCTSIEIESTWRNLTDTGKVILPKSVYVRDGNNNLMPLAGTNVNIGGFDSTNPLFMKGDKITMQYGYAYKDANGNDVQTMFNLFSGWISDVIPAKPMELMVEDNMWKLKQIYAPNKNYSSSTTMESIVRDMLTGTGFTVNALTQTTLGPFTTQNETVAEVLARIRKDYHFEAYFRGTELRIGSLVYVTQDAINNGTHSFIFHKNIIESKLEYQRKDDLQLSGIGYSVNKVSVGGTTKAGKPKTKQSRLEVLVKWNVQTRAWQTIPKPVGGTADYAPNTAGERRTFYFWNVTDNATLANKVIEQLQKYHYTGFKGRFTTFGMPFVQHGDYVNILSSTLPEKNGQYVVRQVNYSVGNGGIRQEIELDFIITRLDANGNAIGL